MRSVTSAQFQVDLWKKNKDIYSDQIYWRNEVNGNITYDRPGLHHYLPPNFQIPIPPVDLPEDIPLETSSSDDSAADGWLERYENRRRQKKQEETLLKLALHSGGCTARDHSDSASSSDSEQSTNKPDAMISADGSIHWESSDVNIGKSDEPASSFGEFGMTSSDLPPREGSSTYLTHATVVENKKDSSSCSESTNHNSSRQGRSDSASASVSASASASASFSERASESASASVSASANASANGSVSESASVSISAKVIASKNDFAEVTSTVDSSNVYGATNANNEKVDMIPYNFGQESSSYATNYDDRSAAVPVQGNIIHKDEVIPYEERNDLWFNHSLGEWCEWDLLPIEEQEKQWAVYYEKLEQDNAVTQSNGELVDPGEGTIVAVEDNKNPDLSQAPPTNKYSFRKLLNKYNYGFDENEEEYVGAVNSSASNRLLDAIEYARDYMKNNRLYLLRNQLRAIGGGKPNKKKGSIVKSENDNDQARAAAHQSIDLYEKPTDLGIFF